MDEPIPGSQKWGNAMEELERYQLEFPPGLLPFRDIKLLYQVEAMVWFHGIFLILCKAPCSLTGFTRLTICQDGKMDLYGLFEDRSWVSTDAFSKAAEHALLLGEVCFVNGGFLIANAKMIMTGTSIFSAAHDVG